ncbi:MAG: DNA recombination protein RmuC [Leptospiraceae bacterium]|nr:DNA recombination protein RmuC [Leptospiraceae bacterium]
MEISSILFLVVGVLLGFALGWLLKKSKTNETSNQDDAEQLKQDIVALKSRLENAIENYKEQKEQIDSLSKQKDELLTTNAQLATNNQNIEEKLREQKQEIEKLQEKFTLEFQNVANKLLKENSKDFAESNQKRLDEILKPLKENIKNFEQKVDDKYEKELKERTSLLEQIKQLSDLNQQMRADAQNLTKALKGDSKTQGNWGEMILEKILENSGLIKGEQYQKEDYYTNQNGGGSRLDIVVKLPEDKQIIIDSKVSITAYTNYQETDDENEKSAHLKAHLASVKSHIDTLSKKDYSQIEGLNTPDFVLMFMPSEPSFSFTLQADSSLYNYAWDRKIVIVSPTTLLATLKTIASIWKQENQNQNALEIARQSGALYDKFVGFLEDLEKIEKGLISARTAYDGAVNKLKDGSGNLIGRVERIKKLGAKTSKSLPSKFENVEDQDLLEDE